MARVFIGLGSNQGDRLGQISRALQHLGAEPGVRVVQMATIIETAPVGPPQDPYLNTVAELDTALEPAALLSIFKRIERQQGRLSKAERWSPRPVDLDLLLYGDRILQDAALTIPHPRMHQRRFVLEPLAQLAPDVMHPIARKTISQLFAECALPCA